MKTPPLFKIIPLILILLFTSCTNWKQPPSNNNGKINAVTTTTMLADLTNTIGGEKVKVIGLMGPGIDPHQFEASAGNVEDMQNSDIIIYNGFHLEGKMGEVFEHMESTDKKVISMQDYIGENMLIKSENNGRNIYDPHIWFDPMIWKECARAISKELSSMDPENAEYYQNNLKNYEKELDELDFYIKTRVQELEPKDRILITAHDAFEYFGKAYGFQVMGLQGINTNSEVSTSDIKTLADFIVENQVKSIFVETSVPTKTIEALQDAVEAKGFNVEIGGQLYSDSLGGEGSGAETYILSYKHNIDTIIDGLK